MESMRTQCALLLGMSLMAMACEESTEEQEQQPTAARPLGETVSYPEGPVYRQGIVYFVEYGAQTIRTWNGSEMGQLWRQDGCGPSGLVLLGDVLVVSCYDSNTVVRVDLTGHTVQTLDQDSAGQPLLGPNDFVADGKGGCYFSASGVFDTAAPVEGKVYHYTADGVITEVARDIHYSNGLTIIEGGRTLLVSEHLEGQVLRYDIAADGTLSGRAVWKRLADLMPPPEGADGYTGPDGLDTDSQGNVYICQYGGGRVLVTRPDGTLLRTLQVPAPYVTNIGFGETDGMIYVTAVRDTAAPPYPGNLYEMSHP